MSISSFIGNLCKAHIVTKNVRIDGSSDGLNCLKQFLAQLQNRLDGHISDAHATTAAMMRYAVGDIIAKAYQDFNAFSQDWECTLQYNEHPELSNVFGIKLTEKNGCPRSHEFKFTGLRQVQL